MISTGPVLILAMLAGPSTEAWRPPELRVKPPPPVTDFEGIKSIAFRLLGAPYQMGGVGSPGIDCSAFVCRVYAEAGYAIPRVSRDQARAGRPVLTQSLRPGDLLFFADQGRPISHVGMYLGQNELIHASSGQGEVVIADLGARWFQERLVFARRVLTSSTATTAEPILPPVQAIELVEHTGETELLPMLRRPPKQPPPSYGPELSGGGVGYVGLRGAVLSEGGTFGLTLAPEAALFVESLALTVAVAVPIRFEVGQSPSVGDFETKGDYLKFLRTVTLGLPGADLYVSMSRLSDLSLLDGELVRHLLPAASVRSVPGLTVARSPLSLTIGARAELVTLETVIDDVVDPGLLGVSGEVQLLDRALRLGLVYAGDQRAEWRGNRRAINGVEGSASWVPIESSTWTLGVSARGTGIFALDQAGGTIGLLGTVERRFGRNKLLGAEVFGHFVGAHAIAGPFGPTYVAYRSEHLAALEVADRRFDVGGEMRVGWGRFTVGGRYRSGLGAHRLPFDERLEALVAFEGLSLGGTRLLDVRAVYAARSPFAGRPVLDYLQAGLRVRLKSWLFLEGYLGKGESLEGGAGATIAFIP